HQLGALGHRRGLRLGRLAGAESRAGRHGPCGAPLGPLVQALHPPDGHHVHPALAQRGRSRAGVDGEPLPSDRRGRAPPDRDRRAGDVRGALRHPRARRARVRLLLQRGRGVPLRLHLPSRQGEDLLLQPRRPGLPRLPPSRRASRDRQRGPVGVPRGHGPRGALPGPLRDRLVPHRRLRTGRRRRRGGREGRMNAAAPDPVPVVVIGAGGMGRTWISTVLGNPAAHLVGVADVAGGAAERAVAELVPPDLRGHVVTGTDGIEVARRAGAEAVIDVTIHAAHHAVTAAALHAGYPVLGEKPCAATLAEALSLAGHAETTGLLFMVSQSRRNNPHLHEARRLAEELGGAGIVDTRFAKAPRFGGFRDEMAHPLLVDMAIHAFDAGRVLLAGLPVSVTATSYNPGWSWYAGDAAATAVITYDSGAVHTYSGSWCSPGDETSWNGDWALSCERGTVRWDGESPPTAHLPGREPV